MSDEEIAKLAMKAGLIERLDLTRFDWLPSLREFAIMVQSAERERCSQYLTATERERLQSVLNASLRQTMDAMPNSGLACQRGDEPAAGYAWLDVDEGKKK